MREEDVDVCELRRELSRYKNLCEELKSHSDGLNGERGEIARLSAYNEELVAMRAELARANARNELVTAELHNLKSHEGKGRMNKAGETKRTQRLDFANVPNLLIESFQSLSRSDLCSLAGVSRHFYCCTEDRRVLPVKAISNFALHMSDGVAIVAGRRRLESPLSEPSLLGIPPWTRFQQVYIRGNRTIGVEKKTLPPRAGFPPAVVSPNPTLVDAPVADARRDSIDFLVRLRTLHGAKCFEECVLELVLSHSTATMMSESLETFPKCRAIALIDEGIRTKSVQREQLDTWTAAHGAHLSHPSLVRCDTLYISMNGLLQLPHQLQLSLLCRDLVHAVLAAMEGDRHAPAMMQQRIQLRSEIRAQIERIELLFDAQLRQPQPESTLELRTLMEAARAPYREHFDATPSLAECLATLEDWLGALDANRGRPVRELLISHSAGLFELLHLLSSGTRSTSSSDGASTPRQVIIIFSFSRRVNGTVKQSRSLEIFVERLRESFNEACTPSPFVVRFPSVRFDPAVHDANPSYNGVTGELFKCYGSEVANGQDDEIFPLSPKLFPKHAYLVVSRLPCGQSAQ